MQSMVSAENSIANCMVVVDLLMSGKMLSDKQLVLAFTRRWLRL